MTATKRIALILTVVFLIPALFFSVYEISSLTKDEKMIAEVYQKQLETILFSVNQYSDDAVNSWMTKIEAGFYQLAIEKSETNTLLENQLLLNSSLKAIFRVDTIAGKGKLSIFSLDSITSDTLLNRLDKILTQQSPQIQLLVKYRKSGFQKNEVLTDSLQYLTPFYTLIFISQGTQTPWQVTGFVIDPELFIEDLVGPRIQKIAKEQFVLSVYKKDDGNRLYSTLPNDSTRLSDVSLLKDFWIFPNYAVGIRTEGASLQQVVRQRTLTNLSLLIGLDVVLIVALVLAFRSVKKEVQLAQNKADFVSNVSHEIRTPLALIRMFAETLEMGRVPSEEKRNEYYSIISKETQRLSGIVNKILNFSQTEAGRKKLLITQVDLIHETTEVLRTYDFHLKSKGFQYQIKKNQPVLVEADREALVETIINLIDNAMKYSADQKQIELVIGSDAGMGWIAIRDHGIGISMADQKHIFDKFYRVSSGNLAKSQGTGLGLSLVKQLIEQQKGKITVSSDVGKGSTFTIYLPLSIPPS
jgi:two-component system, OmpR family, phosphate regulon sensor histidine kinase PhoR